ncbi:hypothetical protein OTU49_012788 [Cherax quadricarinatus]|uniref:BZIP domain-containing protein n=2 Tax=Cherax quadricarinatus TaxID=27406 RepID=A0AAW0VYK8_CHEQU
MFFNDENPVSSSTITSESSSQEEMLEAAAVRRRQRNRDSAKNYRERQRIEMEKLETDLARTQDVNERGRRALRRMKNENQKESEKVSNLERQEESVREEGRTKKRILREKKIKKMMLRHQGELVLETLPDNDPLKSYLSDLLSRYTPVYHQ